MKKIIFVVICASLVLSCQNDNFKDQNQGSNEISNLEKSKNLKGQVPREHEIWDHLLHPENTDLDKLTELYTSRISFEKTDYSDNLKQMTIHAIYENGLIESKDKKLNDYFIKEQLKLTSNFLSIPQFYQSLKLVEDNYTEEELTKFALTFDKINSNAIEKTNWRDTKRKEELTKSLILQRLTYYRHGFWKK